MAGFYAKTLSVLFIRFRNGYIHIIDRISEVLHTVSAVFPFGVFYHDVHLKGGFFSSGARGVLGRVALPPP